MMSSFSFPSAESFKHPSEKVPNANWLKVYELIPNTFSILHLYGNNVDILYATQCAVRSLLNEFFGIRNISHFRNQF